VPRSTTAPVKIRLDAWTNSSTDRAGGFMTLTFLAAMPLPPYLLKLEAVFFNTS
jgi:hypothetical protein